MSRNAGRTLLRWRNRCQEPADRCAGPPPLFLGFYTQNSSFMAYQA
jgi:hypothetical protein